MRDEPGWSGTGRSRDEPAGWSDAGQPRWSDTGHPRDEPPGWSDAEHPRDEPAGWSDAQGPPEPYDPYAPPPARPGARDPRDEPPGRTPATDHPASRRRRNPDHPPPAAGTAHGEHEDSYPEDAGRGTSARDRGAAGHAGGEQAGATTELPAVPAAGSKAPRGGRNLPAAIGVGLGLGVLVLGSLAHPLAFAAVVALAAGAGVWEMVRAVRSAGMRAPLPPLLLGAAIIPFLGFVAGPDGLAIGLLVTVLATSVWRLGDGPAGYERDIAAGALIALYVPFLLGFAAPLALAPDGMLRVLLTLAVVVLSDTGGYAVGVRFGKHPLAPQVSPNKSREGLLGSLAAAGLGGLGLGWALLDLAPWAGLVFGVAVAAMAVVGDLTESMIKRDLRVKDMSNLLPGHGGLMDRLDSIIFAVPTAYLLLSVLIPG
nr:phosphatidate cytidylyltransferase [Pilimelia anulata]